MTTNLLPHEDIMILLRGLKANFQAWEEYKTSIESEREIDDPERPLTKLWNLQLAWAAQWRVSLEHQMNSLRRMVGNCLGQSPEQTGTLTLDQMIAIMGVNCHESVSTHSPAYYLAGSEGHTVVR
jgi:hypothetical protein